MSREGQDLYTAGSYARALAAVREGRFKKEINEAFSGSTVAILKELNLDPAVVNVNGGAVVLGHPIGASGCRVLVTLIHEMIRQDKKTGLAFPLPGRRRSRGPGGGAVTESGLPRCRLLKADLRRQ